MWENATNCRDLLMHLTDRSDSGMLGVVTVGEELGAEDVLYASISLSVMVVFRLLAMN